MVMAVEPAQETPVLQTEAAEEVVLPADGAAEEGVDEPTGELPEPIAEAPPTSDADTLKAELAEVRKQQAELQQRLEDREKRDRQSRKAQERQAEAQKRSERERAELGDVLTGTLGKYGYTDVPAEPVNELLDRYFDRKASTVHDQASSTVDRALDYFMGQADADDLSEREESMVRRMAPKLQEWAKGARGNILSSGITEHLASLSDEDFAKAIPADKLKKLLDGRIAQRNQQNRTDDNIKRVPGDASTTDRSLQAMTDRIISGTHDDEDKRLWEARFGRK